MAHETGGRYRKRAPIKTVRRRPGVEMKPSSDKVVTMRVLTLALTAGPTAVAVGGTNTAAPGGEMGADVFLLFLYVSLALVVSFLCSVAEAVLLSVTPSYIEGLKETRPQRATLLKRLKQDRVDQALAAILTLNTVAHTVGAIGAGAKATVIFGSSWFGLFSAAMTLMILFLSEIIPKTIGAVYWAKLAGPVAFFVQLLIVGLYPIVRISEGLTIWIAKGRNVQVFSRDEFIAMARMGEFTGHLQEGESRIIRNLFRFETLRITDIMTPRTVISALAQDMTIAEALRSVTKTPFSRLPLYKRNLDDITGFVLKNDVLLFNAQGRGEEALATLRRDMLAVPVSVSLSVLLENFLKNRHHIAIVVDEHGGTMGLVTLEDLIETMTGMEIMDETDNVEDMRALARKRWLERAKALGIAVETMQPVGCESADAAENTQRDRWSGQ